MVCEGARDNQGSLPREKSNRSALPLTEERLKALRQVVSTWRQDPVKMTFDFKQCRYPPLFELFWWRRVVMDEFHESESWEYQVRQMMKGISASSRVCFCFYVFSDIVIDNTPRQVLASLCIRFGHN